MSKPVYDTYIPSFGNEDADIMCVGEAGGKKEREQREPFVGKSGQLLRDYLSRQGLRVPRDVFLTNLCKRRPKKNQFKRVVGTRYLKEGLAELEEEIERVDPNLIVALGNWPLYYLTEKTASKGKPGTGIMSWRGSILPGTGVAEGRKVLACLHPAFLLRTWSWHPVFNFDLQYAKKQMEFPDIRYPEYDTYVAGNDESHPDYVGETELQNIVGEMMEAEWLTVDIETFRDNTMSCCGFSDRPDRALVITFQRKGGWQYVKELLASDARKNFQFGTYDAPFLDKFYGFGVETYRVEYARWQNENPPIIKNVGWDTYVAAATLMPEFPRGLDFLASVYTDFPYYKEDRKEWKEGSVDFSTLWAYNAKDVVAQSIVAGKQMKELSEMWDFDVPAQFMEV